MADDKSETDFLGLALGNLSKLEEEFANSDELAALDSAQRDVVRAFGRVFAKYNTLLNPEQDDQIFLDSFERLTGSVLAITLVCVASNQNAGDEKEFVPIDPGNIIQVRQALATAYKALMTNPRVWKYAMLVAEDGLRKMKIRSAPFGEDDNG